MIVKVFLLQSNALIIKWQRLPIPNKILYLSNIIFPSIFMMDSQCYWAWQAGAICWHLWELGTPGIREQVGLPAKKSCPNRAERFKQTAAVPVGYRFVGCHLPLVIQAINFIRPIWATDQTADSDLGLGGQETGDQGAICQISAPHTRWQYHGEWHEGPQPIREVMGDWEPIRGLGSVCFMDLTHWHESRQTTF